MLLSLWSDFWNWSADAMSTCKPNARMPRPATTEVHPETLFGVNIHIGYNWITAFGAQTPASYALTGNDLGIQWYRTQCTNASNAAALQPYFTSMRQAGIEPLVVVIMEPDADWGATYQQNYKDAYSIGYDIGVNLKGYCTWFETSNEIDFKCRTDVAGLGGGSRTTALNGISVGGVNGQLRGDYDPQHIEAFCGWNTGMADGIRMSIPDAKIGHATGTAFGYIMGEMWAKGMDRDGNYVRPCCQVDFMGLHWYDGMGDPRSCGQSYSNVPALKIVNIFQETITRMGCGTLITEWGSTQAGTAQAAWATLQGTDWFNHRVGDQILGAIWYALFPNAGDNDTNNWGLIQADGTTKKPVYTAMQQLAHLK